MSEQWRLRLRGKERGPSFSSCSPDFDVDGKGALLPGDLLGSNTVLGNSSKKRPRHPVMWTVQDDDKRWGRTSASGCFPGLHLRKEISLLALDNDPRH